MARKSKPKKSLDGDLVRTVISPGKGEDNYPLGRSVDFQSEGYHSKPTGGPSNTKHGSKRKDFPFFKHTTKGK